MKRIGVTGQSGFVGSHLYNTLGLYPEQFTRIDFKRECFQHPAAMDEFVQQCDVIVHLAGVNRHPDPEALYAANLALTDSLIASLQRTGSTAHVLFSSSTQEERNNHYGNAKKTARQQLEQWAKDAGGVFITKVKLRSLYTLIITGTGEPTSMPCVCALKALQNSIMLTPC